MTGHTAIFRADASPYIGGGHIARCLTLANALTARGWQCVFAVSAETEITAAGLPHAGHRLIAVNGNTAADLQDLWPDQVDLLVTDHYALDGEWETRQRPHARRIFAIDDLVRRHDCDVLLDQTLGRTEADYRSRIPDGCTLLLGPEYALLRPEFAAERNRSLARRARAGPVGRILISLGATDPTGDTLAVLDALAEADTGAAIDVVIGSGSAHLEAIRKKVAEFSGRASLHVDTGHMARLMADADLAIGAAGSTSWERCCLGLPTILLVLAENQQSIAEALVEHEAAVLYENNGIAFDANRFNLAVTSLCRDSDKRMSLSRNAARLCTGMGTEHVIRGLAA